MLQLSVYLQLWQLQEFPKSFVFVTKRLRLIPAAENSPPTSGALCYVSERSRSSSMRGTFRQVQLISNIILSFYYVIYRHHWHNEIRWRPVRSKCGAPTFETEIFQKQMYRFEESACHIAARFRRTPQWFGGAPMVIRHPGIFSPFPPTRYAPDRHQSLDDVTGKARVNMTQKLTKALMAEKRKKLAMQTVQEM